MFKWALLGILGAIAWAIQARVNEHDRLAGDVYNIVNFQKIYWDVGARYLEADTGELQMGLGNYQNRVNTYLKDTYSHRELRNIIKEHGESPMAAKTEMVQTREAVKDIAKQVAKSYEAMLRKPDAEVSTRGRRRRR